MRLPDLNWRLAIAAMLLGLTSPLYPQPVLTTTISHSTFQQAKQLYDLGVEQYNQRQFSQALKTYQKVLEIYRHGKQEDIAKTLYAIGITYIQLAQYQNASDFLNQALVLYRNIGERHRICDTLNSLGAVYNHLGNYSQALSYYQQALAISPEVGVTADILNNIGGIYQATGQYNKALEYYQRTLDIHQKIGNKTSIAHTLNSIGGVYYEQGQYSQALKLSQLALANAQSAQNLREQGNILNNIGLIESELGQYISAIQYYQQSLAIRRKIGDYSGVGTTLNNLGFAYNHMKKHSQALEFYQQAYSVFRSIGNQANVGKTLNNIGFTYQALGQYSLALKSLEEALAILQKVGTRPSVGRTLDSIGTVYKSLGKYSQALEAYQQALVISREAAQRQTVRVILSNIGDVLAKQNQPKLAIIFYKQSVNVTEAIRKELRSLAPKQQQSYTVTIADTYRRLADLLLQEDRVLEAQQVLDLLKVQELDDYLRNVRGNEKTALGIDALPPEKQINDGLDTILNRQIQLGKKLAELQNIPLDKRNQEQVNQIAQITKQQQEISQEFNEFLKSEEVVAALAQLNSTARQQSVPLRLLKTLPDNLQRLNQNAVLLYPLILENRLELVLTTPYTPPIRRKVEVKKEELNRAIVELRQALENPDANVKVAAQKLYNWLIKPIEKELAAANAKTIIYAPDGQLRYIPLSALYDGKQWLVQRFRTNYITAVSLTELDTKPLPKIQILAGATTGRHIVTVGSAALAFSSLPYAGAEVENLAAMMPGTKKLLDSEFSREKTIPFLNNYTFVHMATHAMFVTGKPEDSFILLGDGDKITLAEIQNWSLPNVDLVVLSGCQTAISGNGEEILGFGYQMQDAGARAAIASLWKVNDGGTQALMSTFYAALRQGITKAEALRYSQIAMITGNYSEIAPQDRGILQSTRDRLPPKVTDRLSHPYYWAPFILIGNGL
ncbi:tetratricopeptide repeat protein [Iningainema tapete]|uniref:Tetratricopeptide repeat protein n=1 Tax=Iningainema tapete BLCC-T55 TaxID=2748662 RepID=A0A8J6XKM2_9CYAN|nr:tetratricopeptide repeat protein [Iningainema tapete]MBD2773299.1 tetratricopeptide repeat protein [Iningainema tapete BLCC-T55]